MAQLPPMVTTKLKGEAPDVFTGERNKSDAYKQQFQVYQYMNPNNEIICTPYYRVMQHVLLIKGEKVNDWKEDQIQALVNKTTRTQNPMLYEDEALWTQSTRQHLTLHLRILREGKQLKAKSNTFECRATTSTHTSQCSNTWHEMLVMISTRWEQQTYSP